MLTLSNLSPHPGSTKSRKRVGRGQGSGHGKTAGKGHKGVQARSGRAKGGAFEGGQTPLVRRDPAKVPRVWFPVHSEAASRKNNNVKVPNTTCKAFVSLKVAINIIPLEGPIL